MLETYSPICSPQSKVDKIDETIHLEHNADLLFKNNEFSLAKSIYAKLHEAKPEESKYLERLGYCFKNLKQFENAELCFCKWVELKDDFESLVCLASFYYEQKSFLRAKRFYLRALCVPKENNELLFTTFKNLGNISLLEKDFEQAEDYYNRAQRLNPESDVLSVNYGSLFFQLNDIPKAIFSYQEALRINPKNAKAWMGLSLMYRHCNELDLSWGNLQNALENDPNNISTLKLCTKWGLAEYKYDLAIDFLERFIEKNEFNAEVSNLLACVYYQAGEEQSSIFELDKVLSFEPDNEDAIKLKNAIVRGI